MEHVCQILNVVYWVVGYEICPATKRHHLQGYIYLQNPVSFNGVKDAFGDDTHIECAHGSPSDNRKYCTKDGVFVEHGQLPQQGKRRDIDDLREMMDEGKSLRECLEASRSYQAAKHCQLLFSLKKPKMEFKKKEVLWYWGATGTGKSRAAFALMNERGMSEKAWISGSTLKWFQFYVDEEFVIFDDLRFNSTEFSTLLRLLDGYPFCVEYKGGAVWWKPSTIVVTSPRHPRDFSNVAQGEDVAQLLRRIDVIKEFRVAEKKDAAPKEVINIE